MMHKMATKLPSAEINADWKPRDTDLEIHSNTLGPGEAVKMSIARRYINQFESVISE